MEKSEKQQEIEKAAQVEKETLFKGKTFSLEKEVLHFSDQDSHQWDIIVHPGAVAILPIQEDGSLLLIKQWRRAIGKVIFEIAAGTLDNKEAPLTCAMREIQEEVGVKAETFIPLGGFYSAPGFCTEYIHLFLAKDLSESSLPGDPHEAIDVVEVTLEQAIGMLHNEEIEDAKTILALLRYKEFKENFRA